MPRAESEPQPLATRGSGTAERSRSPRRGLWLRACIGAALLAAVVSNVDVAAVSRLLREVHPGYFVACIGIVLFERCFMAYKWNLLTQVKGIGISLWQSVKVYLLSNFVGLFLPTGVGGDVYRIYHTSRAGGRGEEIAASVVIERVLGTVGNAVLAALGLLVMLRVEPDGFLGQDATLAILVLLLGTIVAFWVSMQSFSVRPMEYLLERSGSNRILRKLLRAQHAYVDYRRHRGALALFFSLTLLQQLGLVVFNFVAAQAIGIDLGFLYFLAVVPICRIVIRIPVSINSIGVREGIFVLLFTRVGLSGSEALSLALVGRVAHWLAMIPGAVLYVTESPERRAAVGHPTEAVVGGEE